MKLWLRHILRWGLPWACAGCREPLDTVEDSGFCGTCWLQLKRLDAWVCRSCGVPLHEGEVLCYTCLREPFPLLIRGAFAYKGVVAHAIQRFKYKGRDSLAEVFGPLLFQAIAIYPELLPVDWVVPVPLHETALKRRGYNQADRLACALGSRGGGAYVPDLLFRRRKTTPQVHLNREQRAINMEGVFGVRESPVLRAHSVLLIDDVCTTGATLLACAKALKRAHVKSVKALVLARD